MGTFRSTLAAEPPKEELGERTMSLPLRRENQARARIRGGRAAADSALEDKPEAVGRAVGAIGVVI